MVTISVKIPKSLKLKIKRSHMKLSKEVRGFLETRTLEEEAQRLDRELRKYKNVFSKIKIEDVVEDLRNDRYGNDR